MRHIHWWSAITHLEEMDVGERVVLQTPKGIVTIGRGRGDVFAAKGSTLTEAVRVDKLGLIKILYLKEFTK